MHYDPGIPARWTVLPYREKCRARLRETETQTGLAGGLDL